MLRAIAYKTRLYRSGPHCQASHLDRVMGTESYKPEDVSDLEERLHLVQKSRLRYAPRSAIILSYNRPYLRPNRSYRRAPWRQDANGRWAIG